MDPTRRFTSRVTDYVRYRPGYPRELITHLCDIVPGTVALVADIGCGTGKLAEGFLERGLAVVGVEPNEAMRAAGEVHLRNYEGFRSTTGTAERTGIVELGCFDLVVAGQAFHWFDSPRARKEFSRLLRPGGLAALVWNNRETRASPFLREYEEMVLRLCEDYPTISATHAARDEIEAFFEPLGYQEVHYPNAQALDRDALRGRVTSSSYVPKQGPVHAAIMRELDGLYERYAEDGIVRFEYDTVAFYGPLE